MFSEMLKHFGTIDILVNNAGLQRDAAFHEMTLEQWNAVIATNLTGQFLCAREAVANFCGAGFCPRFRPRPGKSFA
jgi:Dehydrogenases with different specificities (related to short-chain alcohol dehydrogenases)